MITEWFSVFRVDLGAVGFPELPQWRRPDLQRGALGSKFAKIFVFCHSKNVEIDDGCLELRRPSFIVCRKASTCFKILINTTLAVLSTSSYRFDQYSNPSQSNRIVGSENNLKIEHHPTQV